MAHGFHGLQGGSFAYKVKFIPAQVFFAGFYASIK
jgi:hypothetical protein